MKSKITILGAGGKMGKWFSKYFVTKGFIVTGYDSDNEVTTKSVIKSDSLIGSVLGADYVILCIPVKRTPEIIRLVSKEMRRDSYLIDISSLKAKVIIALTKMPSKINPICIHPMFGPGTKNVKGQNIISIPIKDTKKELAKAKSLFPGANFVTIDSSEHDKIIAVILGLIHLVNLSLANILAKDQRISLTQKMSGTTYKAQTILAAGIMTESPQLIETLISNPELKRHAEEFWKDIGRLLTLVQEGKSDQVIEYIKSTQEALAKNVDLENSYKKLLTMTSAIEK